jgi:hypothetical protein
VEDNLREFAVSKILMCKQDAEEDTSENATSDVWQIHQKLTAEIKQFRFVEMKQIQLKIDAGLDMKVCAMLLANWELKILVDATKNPEEFAELMIMLCKQDAEEDTSENAKSDAFITHQREAANIKQDWSVVRKQLLLKKNAEPNISNYVNNLALVRKEETPVDATKNPEEFAELVRVLFKQDAEEDTSENATSDACITHQREAANIKQEWSVVNSKPSRKSDADQDIFNNAKPPVNLSSQLFNHHLLHHELTFHHHLHHHQFGCHLQSLCLHELTFHHHLLHQFGYHLQIHVILRIAMMVLTARLISAIEPLVLVWTLQLTPDVTTTILAPSIPAH